MIDFITEQNRMFGRALLAIACLVQFPVMGISQTSSAHQGVVDLPQGPLTRIPSPDRKWTLIFECPNDCASRKLWIEENASHARKLVNKYERNLRISWTPNSHAFFVNDEYGSDGTLCYVYDAADLKVTDIATLLTSGDPEVTQFLKAGHSYLTAKRWINSHELVVVLYGHFDEPPPRGFSLRFRVDINGRAQKLSQRAEEDPQ